MSFKCFFNFVWFLPITGFSDQFVTLPDDLIISDVNYGADVLVLLLDFFVVLFLVAVSLTCLHTYNISAAAFDRFIVVSNLYLFL